MTVKARRCGGLCRAIVLTAAGIGLSVALAGCTSTTAGTPDQSISSAPSTPESSSSETPTTPPATRGAAFLDGAAVQKALDDASHDLVAANTYDYGHLAEYRRTALAVTTGSFTQTLAQTIDGVIARNAPKLHAKQVAKVNRIGLADMRGEDATVLIFGQLTVRNDTYPSGRTDPFDVVAGIQRVDQRWLLTRLATDGAASCDPPGTAALATACMDASSGAAAMTTFRRSTFNSDFHHLTSLLTGSLLADVRAQKRATLHAMLTGGFDLRSEVVASAVETATPDQVEVLVALNGYRSTSNTPIPQRLSVTIENVRGRWLLSDVRSVGGS